MPMLSPPLHSGWEARPLSSETGPQINPAVFVNGPALTARKIRDFSLKIRDLEGPNPRDSKVLLGFLTNTC